MHAKFGDIATDTDDVFKFNEQVVNLANFLASETNYSMIGFSSAGLAGLATILMIFNWTIRLMIKEVLQLETEKQNQNCISVNEN